jgi:hypothetical protein
MPQAKRVRASSPSCTPATWIHIVWRSADNPRSGAGFRYFGYFQLTRDSLFGSRTDREIE